MGGISLWDVISIFTLIFLYGYAGYAIHHLIRMVQMSWRPYMNMQPIKRRPHIVIGIIVVVICIFMLAWRVVQPLI